MSKKLKIREKDMTKVRFKGRGVYGLFYHDEKKIEIEKTLRGKLRFLIYNHELLHSAFPKLTERQISRGARIITEALWKRGFRGIK